MVWYYWMEQASCFHSYYEDTEQSDGRVVSVLSAN